MIAANYEVRLYLNGNLIGDVRPLAQNLSWSRKRTKVGADAVDIRIPRLAPLVEQFVI